MINWRERPMRGPAYHDGPVIYQCPTILKGWPCGTAGCRNEVNRAAGAAGIFVVEAVYPGDGPDEMVLYCDECAAREAPALWALLPQATVPGP